MCLILCLRVCLFTYLLVVYVSSMLAFFSSLPLYLRGMDQAHSSSSTMFSFYSSHGSCWLWDPTLVSLHAISDLITFICYVLIPLIALYIYLTGNLSSISTLYPKLWLTGGAFVFFCGLSHFGSAIEIWIGGYFYYITGVNKIFMAIASISFVVLFWRERESILTVVRVLNAVKNESNNDDDGDGDSSLQW